jgi:hypothetical protein
MKPISTYMSYDEITHRYRLTADYARTLDPDIVNELKNPNDIETLIEEVSDDIYNYVHEHSIYNDAQDLILSHTEGGRRVILEAMKKQLLYVSAVGDPSLFLDEAKRKFWISEKAKRVLLQTIPELGCCILYAGRFEFSNIKLSNPLESVPLNKTGDLFE